MAFTQYRAVNLAAGTDEISSSDPWRPTWRKTKSHHSTFRGNAECSATTSSSTVLLLLSVSDVASQYTDNDSDTLIAVNTRFVNLLY